VGALSDPALMEEIIASGNADVVELTRGLYRQSGPAAEGAVRARATKSITCMRCCMLLSSLLTDRLSSTAPSTPKRAASWSADMRFR
jgi:2,4-dienoyl-CoA reductase-like NADH-dependent reductase (Old Yellow Enzyme family)